MNSVHTPFGFLKGPNTFLPQVFCTFCSLCLDCSFLPLQVSPVPPHVLGLSFPDLPIIHIITSILLFLIMATCYFFHGISRKLKFYNYVFINVNFLFLYITFGCRPVIPLHCIWLRPVWVCSTLVQSMESYCTLLCTILLYPINSMLFYSVLKSFPPIPFCANLL